MKLIQWFKWRVWFITRNIRRVKRLLRWIPVIWVDRDWDWAFIILLLEFKLSQVRKALYGVAVGSEKSARKIWELEQVLNRIHTDNYYNNASNSDFQLKDEHAHSRAQFEQDIDFVAMYLKKYLHGWWN